MANVNEPFVEMSPDFQRQLCVSKKGGHVGHVDFTVELRDTLYMALDQDRVAQMIAQIRSKKFATNGLYSLCQVVYASNALAPGQTPRVSILEALRYMRDNLTFFVMETPWFASNQEDRVAVQRRLEAAFEVYVGLMLEQPVTVQSNDRLVEFLPRNSDAMLGTQEFLSMLYNETQNAPTGLLSTDSDLQLEFMLFARHCCEQSFASFACYATDATVDDVEEACRLLSCFLNEAHDRPETAALHVVELCVQKIHSLAATSEFNYEEDVKKLADDASKPVPKFLEALHGYFHECLGNRGYESLFATSTAFQGDALEVARALALEQIEEQKSRDAAYAARVSVEWNEEGEARRTPPAAAPAAQKKTAALSEVEMARQLAQQALSPPSSPPHPLVMELEALRADHASLAAFHRGVMAERDSLDAERSSLEAAHHNLQDEYEKLANGVQGLQQDKQALYRLRGEHTALQETYDVLKAENESLRAEAKPSEPKCLERAAAEAQELREQLEAREAELKACQVELQEEAGKFIAAHGVLQDENQRLKAQLQGLGNGTDALDQAIRENQLLKEQLRGLEEGKEALEQQLHDAAQAKGRIEAADDKARYVQAELELVDVNGQLEEEQRKCCDLTKELGALREHTEGLQGKLFVLLLQLSHIYFPFIKRCPTWNENYHRHLFLTEKCYPAFYEAMEKYNDMTEDEWRAFAEEIKGQGNGSFTTCLLHLFDPAIDACHDVLAEDETVERLAKSETFQAQVPALLKRVVGAKETPESVRSPESEAVVQHALKNGTAAFLIACLNQEGVVKAPADWGRTVVKERIRAHQHYELLSGVQAIADAAADDLDSRATEKKAEAELLGAEQGHEAEVRALASDIGAWEADAEAFRDLSTKLAPGEVKRHFSHDMPNQSSFTMELLHLMMRRIETAPSVETDATAE